MTAYRYLATCPTGIGTLLMQELASLGADDLIEKPVGVSFSGDLALAYRVCLWSRLANRVVLQLSNQEVESAEGLYQVVGTCLLYTSPSPRDRTRSRMPSSA